MLKQVSLNSFWLLSGRILTLGLNVIFVALIARRLGVNVFGQYALFTSIAYLGNFFTTYGTDVLLIREISRTRVISNSVFTSLWLQLFLSCIWILIISFACLFFIDDIGILKTLVIVNISLIPLAFQAIYNSILRAFERMDIYAGLNLFSVFGQAVLSYFLIHTKDDFFKLGAVILFSQIFTACIGYFICRAILPSLTFIKKVSVLEVLFLFRTGWRLALLAPLATLFQRMNLFIVSIILGAEASGFLSAASRLVEGIKIAHFSVSNSLMPTMARPNSTQTDSTLRFSLFFLLLWSFTFALFLMFFASSVVELIYGSSYSASIIVLQVTGWVLIPYTFSIYYSLKLTMRGFETLVLKANLITLPCAIVLYFALIVKFGLLGSVWGVLVNEIMLAFLLFFFYYRLTRSI